MVGGVFFVVEGADVSGDECFDAVSESSCGLVEVGGVVEFPVFVAFAGVERAGVAASHGDDVGGADDFLGRGLGNSWVMSIPASAVRAIVVGLIFEVGSQPAE